MTSYRFLLFCFFMFLGLLAKPQLNSAPFSENANLLLQQIGRNNETKNQQVQVFVKGDKEKIYQAVNELNGKIKYQIKGYFNVLITSEKAVLLAKHPDIESLVYYPGKGEVLVDQSLVNTRVNLVRQKASPLNKNYSGKGVILGIIDTGIDPSHPDFQDSLGNTRILAIWDQTKPFDSTLTPTNFGYGQAWDSSAINNGTSGHLDPLTYFGHGTNVSGIAGGNGNSVPDSIANYESYAYDAYFVVVAANFASNNFTSIVADGVEYIFKIADSLGMPAVINASLGQYTGSHDGLDLSALRIDSLLNASTGKSMVAAAGNSGTIAPYHLGYQVNLDTNFTWFLNNPSSALGINAMFFELWADTAQFNQVNFSFGFTDTTTGSLVGASPFDNINNRLNALVADSIFDTSGAYIGLLQTYCERQGGQYLMQALIANPPSNRFYEFRTSGQGRFDVWSASFFGYSNILQLNQTKFSKSGRFLNYKDPDSLQSIVSSWACSPNVITVANYQNRNSYLDMDSVLQTFNDVPGERVASSSRGPSRLGVQKPNVAAPGGLVLCAGLSSDLNQIKAIQSLRSYVGLGGYHRRNGGTSMASPAVAGIVALMLEKCPKLSTQEIITRIENSAFSDSLTNAILPDFEWGAGKVDGFAALLGLDFKPKLVFSSDSLLCAGETIQISTQKTYDTYQWSNGDATGNTTITKKGFYALTVTDSLGCSSTIDSIRVDSVPNPIVNLGADTTICWDASLTLSVDSNLINPIWNGTYSNQNLITNKDTFVTLQVENQFGCLAYDTLKIAYHQKPKPNLGADTSICTGDTLEVYSGFTINLWNDGDTNNLKKLFNTGSFIVEVTDQNSCKAKDTLIINSLYGLPNISIHNDTSLCANDTLMVSLPSHYQYLWENNSTSSSRDFYNSGSYQITITDSIGCSSADTFEIIQIFGFPPINLPNDTSICFGDFVNISLPSNFSYLWSDGLTMSNRQVSTASQYVVEATESNGCVSVDSFSITSLNPLPTFSLLNDTFICSGDSIEIGVSTSNLIYQWNNGTTSNRLWVKTAGMYLLRITDSNSCSFEDSIEIALKMLPAFSLGNDTSLCQNAYTTVFLSGPQNMANYSWNVGQGVQIISVCNGMPGAICDYSIPADSVIILTVTDSSGCIFSDSIHFGVLPKPIIDLGVDTAICGNEPFIIDKNLTSPQFNFFYWDDGTTGPLRQLTEYGSFRVEAIDTNGCSNTDTLTIDSLSYPLFSLGKDTLLPPSLTSFTIGAGIKAQSYLWHNGKTDSSITLKSGSNYPLDVWCEVNNTNGCRFADTLMIDWYLWSVKEQNNFSEELILYPNPANNRIIIELHEKINGAQINIFDSNGRLVISEKNISENQNSTTLDFNLPSGVYLIILENQRKVYSQRYTVY